MDFGNRFQNGIGIMAILKDTVKKQMNPHITKQLINLSSTQQGASTREGFTAIMRKV